MKMLLSDELSLGSLIEVQSRLEAAGLRTPLRATALQSEASTRRIWVKAENLQPTGSFKIRGATNAVSKLSSVQKARGVVAYSTGNHAQAVALAAQRAGIRATIVMSRDVPNDKIDATLRLGAEVLMAESTSEARRLLAERHAAEHDSILIPPYDDYAVMAGQASIGLEILSECQPSAVIVPIGGGGLIAGVAAAVKQVSPKTRVIGVEPEWENDAYLSFRQGRRVALPKPSASIADAIKVQIVGENTFPLIRQYVDDVVLVSEKQIIQAIPFAEEHTGGSVEPAGALAVAAVLFASWSSSAPMDLVAIVSGGNITPERRKTLLDGVKV
jgi:threonine dehydratase